MEIGFVGIAVIVGIVLIWFWNSIYIIKEWERGVVLRLGRLLPEAKGAGIRLVMWPIETLYRISLRLETLDVSLYKKIDFSPDPREQATVWASLAQWASYTVRPPRGRAIVFAVAHLGLDLRKLDTDSLRVTGRRVEVVLPRVQTEVELRPAEVEIIGSNLNSEQTAQLFERARNAFEAEVVADKVLQERARESARQSLRSLFVGLGFSEVAFVEKLSPEPQRG